MKREGRQHGMVRSYRILPSPLNPRPDTRFINKFDSPPTAGFFTKVSSKPTNHSKFTGKCSTPRCSSCHVHPACKSQDKTKGTQKLNSRDVVSNARLATWRVVDARPGFHLSGFSATRVLDHLVADDDVFLEDVVDEEVEINGSEDDDENGVCYDGDDGSLVFELGLNNMEHYDDEVEEDGDWCLVESC